MDFYEEAHCKYRIGLIKYSKTFLQESKTFYKSALIDLAKIEEDKSKKEALLKQAVSYGFSRAFYEYGVFLEGEGIYEDAIFNLDEAFTQSAYKFAVRIKKEQGIDCELKKFKIEDIFSFLNSEATKTVLKEIGELF